MSFLSRAAILGIALAIGACMPLADKEGGVMAQKTIEQVLKEHAPALMAQPGVVGTAQSLCEGRPCIRVFVIRRTPELKEKIPKMLEGYPVMLEETGEIRALPQTPDR